MLSSPSSKKFLKSLSLSQQNSSSPRGTASTLPRLVLFGVGVALFVTTIHSVATYHKVVGLGIKLESQAAVNPNSIYDKDEEDQYEDNEDNYDTEQDTTFATTTMTTTTTNMTRPFGSLCEGYAGILHIREADEYAACGTVFFLHMINQIIYAERHNLVPWIHLNNRSHHVRDNDVHGTDRRKLKVKLAPVASEPNRPALPGLVQFKKAKMQEITLIGNGIWESYFAPVAGMTERAVKDDTSCNNKPVVELSKGMVFPGIHYYAPWSVKAWVYRKKFGPKNGATMQQWYEPMRKRANDIVKRYYRRVPELDNAIQAANPHFSTKNNKCLSIHIRLTDKAAGRQKLSLADFEPYAQAFVQSKAGHTLFIATDDARIIPTIQQTWSQNLGTNLTVHFQKAAKRSSGKEATFRIAPHHRINMEALVDIYGMAQCDCLVHGYSAMSEAAQYIHFPTLHECSVNLDDKLHMSAADFEQLLTKKQEQESQQ